MEPEELLHRAHALGADHRLFLYVHVLLELSSSTLNETRGAGHLSKLQPSSAVYCQQEGSPFGHKYLPAAQALRSDAQSGASLLLRISGWLLIVSKRDLE